MTGYFVSPSSEDDETYIRFSQEIVAKGLRRFLLGGGASSPIRIENAQGEVARSTLADWTLDTTTLPDGHYVAQATNCYPMDFVIRNGTTPVRGPLIPLVQGNMLDEENYGSVGVEWIPYSDPPPLPKGNRIKPRVYAPLDKLPNAENDPTKSNRDQFWMRPLTRTTGVWSTLKQWRADQFGNVQIGHYQLYARFVAQTLHAGNLRDGPYGRGGVGTPVCARELADGSLLVTAINAGVKIIRPDLTVETVWGRRLRDGVPVPSVTYGSGEISDPQFAAHVDSHYEWVGAGPLPKNPWSAIPDPDNPSIIWIANTDGHHVLAYDIIAKRTLAIIGSPTGAMGRSDGVGEDVLMRRPRGLYVRPQDGLLYVAQAWNTSIGVIDRKTLRFEERIKSVNNWENYPAGNVLGTNFYGKRPSDLRPFWEKDGPAGTASFLHPQQMDGFSDGKLCFGCDHTRVIEEYDPDANSIRTLVLLPEGSFAGDDYSYRHTAWISLAVNNQGAGAAKDVIAYADWDQESLSLFARDGTVLPKPLVDPAKPGTRFGLNSRVGTMGYPWGAGWGKDRLILMDAGSESVLELSIRQPTDVDYPDAAIAAGKLAWSTPPPGGGLSMTGRYNALGFSDLGDPQWQDMATLTDAAIEAWLAQRRPDWSAATLANVRTYIRYSQQVPAVDSPPPPPPPPTPSKLAERIATVDEAWDALKTQLGT